MSATVNQVLQPEDAFEVRLPPRPYPGLRPFESHEWPIFFGRESMTDEIVGKLARQQLLVIHGDSGCGKSSLVRAGVLPRLAQENARVGTRWAASVMTPGESPLMNLAAAINEVGPRSPEGLLAARRALNLGEDAPAEIARLLLAEPGDRVLIVIDQFEELFSHSARHGSDDARLLIRCLLAMFKSPPQGLYVLATMRSDFIGACGRFVGFAEAVNASQYLVPCMQRSDLIRAIREPARLYSGEVDLALAEALVSEGENSQDQLPLMQHGLMLLHAHVADKSGWKLDIEAYRHAGGLASQLSEHADRVMQQALTLYPKGAGECSIEQMFRALTEINAEGYAIRRPRSLGDLASITGTSTAILRRVIDLFRQDGTSLLRPHWQRPIDETDLVDISHEALIRSWVRLSTPNTGWIFKEFEDGLVWRALLVGVDDFERDPTNLLSVDRGDWIAGRNSFWAERYGGRWNEVKTLMEASARYARKRLVHSRLIVVACILLGVSLLAVLAMQWSARKEAEVAKIQAQAKASKHAAEASALTAKKAEDFVRQTQSTNVELRMVVREAAEAASSENISPAEAAKAKRGLIAAANLAAPPTEGFAWLPAEGALLDHRGPVPLKGVVTGNTYAVNKNLVLSAYSMRTSDSVVGNVVEGSTIRVESPSVWKRDSRGELSAYVKVRVISGPSRVFVQYATGTPFEFQLIKAQLVELEFQLAPAEHIDLAQGLSEVRYCHADDAEAAQRLARAVQVINSNRPVAARRIGDQSCLRVTSPGTLELWLGKLWPSS